MAEKQTYTWFMDQRKQGLPVSSRQVRNKMRACVREWKYDAKVNGNEFQASSGWFRRFMVRYHLVFRRKNDNATKSLDELLPSVATFINHLRVLRINNPGDDEASPHGKFGPRNSYNLDSVPMPFASAVPEPWSTAAPSVCGSRPPAQGLTNASALFICSSVRRANSRNHA